MALSNLLTIGVSTIDVASQQTEVTGNNIANLSTPGYKGALLVTSDTFSSTLTAAAPSPGSTLPGSNTPGNQIGQGVQIDAIVSKFSQGASEQTGVRSHLAIQGRGFFVVKDSVNSVQYATRAGAFREDDRGYLVTQTQGYRVQGAIKDPAHEPTYSVAEVGGKLVFTKNTPSGTAATPTIGDINTSYKIGIGSGITKVGTFSTFTDTDIIRAAPTFTGYSVDQGGNLIIQLSNQDSFTRGTILLQYFNDELALTKNGNNLYSGFAAAGAQALDINLSRPSSGTLGSIRQSTLESSNVDLTKEFSNLIVGQRTYQAGATVVRTADQILQELISLKR